MTTTCYCCGAEARLTRLHDDGREYECAACRGRNCPDCLPRFTLKDGDPDVYVFFSGDIYAILSADVKPLDLG
jgi:hypothetical protein